MKTSTKIFALLCYLFCGIKLLAQDLPPVTFESTLAPVKATSLNLDVCDAVIRYPGIKQFIKYGEKYNSISKRLTDSIQFLSNLEVLNLMSCYIEEIPKVIGNLKNLRTLNLSGNQIKTIPNEITRLIELTSLEIGANNLDSLPKDFYRLKNLQTLVVGYNNIKKLPDSLIALSKLKTLIVKGSKINSLPTGFGKLSSLKLLDFSMCNFSLFPTDILQLKNLEVLIFYGNQIEQIPDLSPLKSLRKLYIDKSKYNVEKLKQELPNCEIQ